jgi:ubiquitin-conjugating enzyme E2 J2
MLAVVVVLGSLTLTLLLHNCPRTRELIGRMAPTMATARLRKELVALQRDPPPGVIAEPDESNILKWHYAIRGPAGTSFEGGVYIGKLIFPNEYPMKPPSIMMLTPSGRFKVNTRLCLSMSDFHPESWNPMWSVATIIQGVQSFMVSDELTTGGLKSSPSEHKRLAALSMEFNRKMFPNLFGGDLEAALAAADEARKISEAKTASQATTSASTTTTTKPARNRRDKRDKQPPLSANEAAEVANDDLDETDTKKEMSLEEIEKRRKRNAKKRAKQKEKKKSDKGVNEGEDHGDNLEVET